MPTQVNPDSPTATGAGRLQAMVNGPRDPGTPSMAGKPGVQPGRHSFPAPPAPATAPPGKPPDGARKAMQGGAQPTPQQPGTPAPGAAPSSAPQPSAGAPPPTPGSPQPAPGAGSSQTAGVAAPAAPTVESGGMATQTFTSVSIPKPAAVPPNSTVQTPYGTVSSSKPSGLALDAAGQQKYKESMAALRAKFTVPKVMKGMAGLPQMEIKLGASNYDAFSGRFHGKE